MPVNPQSNVTLTESMGDELRSRNNLSDLFNRATAITNLGITATAAKKPVLPGYVVSAVSGVNWQGI